LTIITTSVNIFNINYFHVHTIKGPFGQEKSGPINAKHLIATECHTVTNTQRTYSR